jgi:hypothetical protein
MMKKNPPAISITDTCTNSRSFIVHKSIGLTIDPVTNTPIKKIIPPIMSDSNPKMLVILTSYYLHKQQNTHRPDTNRVCTNQETDTIYITETLNTYHIYLLTVELDTFIRVCVYLLTCCNDWIVVSGLLCPIHTT